MNRSFINFLTQDTEGGFFFRALHQISLILSNTDTLYYCRQFAKLPQRHWEGVETRNIGRLSAIILLIPRDEKIACRTRLVIVPLGYTSLTIKIDVKSRMCFIKTTKSLNISYEFLQSWSCNEHGLLLSSSNPQSTGTNIIVYCCFGFMDLKLQK